MSSESPNSCNRRLLSSASLRFLRRVSLMRCRCLGSQDKNSICSRVRPAKEAARLHQERPGTHCGITDLEIEDLLRPWLLAELLEDRVEGGLNNGFGEGTWCVVRSGASALFSGLQEEATLRNRVRRLRRDLLAQRGDDIRRCLGRLHRVGSLAGQLTTGPVPQRLEPFGGLLVQQLAQIQHDMVWLHADGRSRGFAEFEAHHRLVDGSDLFHVEGAIADALAVEEQEVLEDAVDDTI